MILVFVDMDGVLVDFNRGIKSEFDMEYPKVRIPDSEFEEFHTTLFDKIRARGVDFWKTLPILPDAMDLIHFLESRIPRTNTNILTAWPHTFHSASDQLSCSLGKRFWLEDNVSNHIAMRMNICFAKDKQKQISRFPNDLCVLIDDMSGNIDRWNAAGGVGILHTSSESTIREFKERILNDRL